MDKDRKINHGDADLTKLTINLNDTIVYLTFSC